MANNPELKVRISAELNQIRQSLSQLQNDLVKVGKEGGRAGQDAAAGFASVETAAKRAALAVGGFFTIQGFVGLTKQISAVNSEYQSLISRLKIATGGGEEFANVQRQLFKISQDTSNELGTVIDLYSTLARSTKHLNSVNGEVLVRLTDIVGKYVALSGSSGPAAQAALVQFGQALNNNFSAAAAEINSLNEQAPALARAIEQGLGIATGSLKKFAEEGNLSSELVVNALIKMGDQADEQFGQVNDTVARAMTRLKNEVVLAVGEADLSPLISSIDDLRVQLSDPATLQAIGDFARGIATIAGWTVSIVASVGEMGRNFGFLAAQVAGNVTEMDELEAKIRAIDIALKGGLLDKPLAYAFKDREQLEEIKKNLEIRRDLLLQYGGVVPGVPAADQKAKTEQDAAEKKKRLEEEAEANLAAARAAKEKAKEEELAASAEERRQKAIADLLQNLSDQAATEGRSAEQIARYRLEQLGASEAEIQRALSLVRETEAIKAKVAAEEEAAKRLEIAEKAAQKELEDRKRLEASNAENFEQAQIRLAELEGRALDARLQEIQIKYRSMMADMVKAGDVEGQKLIENLVNKEKARAQFDEIKRQFDETMGGLKAQEESLADRVKVGDISGVEAERQLDEARMQAQTDGQGMIEQAQVLAQIYPELLPLIDQMTAKLNGQAEAAKGVILAQQEVGQSLTRLIEGFASTLASGAIDGLTNAFTSIIDGSKSVGDAMRDFAQEMGQMIISMVARIVATMAVLQTLSAITGVPVSALAKFAGITAGVNHTGGVVGQGGTIRSGVNPLLFAGAPRYHTGGVAGLKPGEMPAILKKGEEVLTENDPRHVRNGGGQGGGSGTRVINVIDPNMVADYMSSSQGEQVLLNVMQRNSGAIKQVTG